MMLHTKLNGMQSLYLLPLIKLMDKLENMMELNIIFNFTLMKNVRHSRYLVMLRAIFQTFIILINI